MDFLHESQQVSRVTPVPPGQAATLAGPGMDLPFVQNVRPSDARLPLIMGVVNVTTDSFYDGGRFVEPRVAFEHMQRLVEEGAEILDLGAESTRPGHQAVSAAAQIERLGPLLPTAVRLAPCVSVDTSDPEVARFALERGARIINDVSCLAEPELAHVVGEANATLVITHSRGPQSQQRGQFRSEDYTDVVAQVRDEWKAAAHRAVQLGVAEGSVWFDPGIGFAKNARQSYEVLRALADYGTMRVPLVLGVSRKSFISAAFDCPAEERLPGTIAACVHAYCAGVAVLRVHDVAALRQALAVTRSIHHPDNQI